jgi:atypical dual specificity phosphatase
VSPLRILRGLGLLIDRGAWIEEGRLLGCAYPRREAAVAWLARQGVSVLVNLHERAHDAARLARHDLTEVHLPVTDFTPPSPAQVDRGVAAIAEALAAGRRVAVHCAGGRGRTGTLLACYLVYRGLDPHAAIARVREARPGSIETRAQAVAVEAYARRLRPVEGLAAGAT